VTVKIFEKWSLSGVNVFAVSGHKT